jgi:hypothetical protein
MGSNPVLTNLNGLKSLTYIGKGLSVENNPMLPTCQAERLRDRIGTKNIGGEVLISKNDDTAKCN